MQHVIIPIVHTIAAPHAMEHAIISAESNVALTVQEPATQPAKEPHPDLKDMSTLIVINK